MSYLYLYIFFHLRANKVVFQIITYKNAIEQTYNYVLKEKKLSQFAKQTT